MLTRSLTREFFEELIKADPFLTIEQVADWLNISRAHAHDLCNLGVIPTVRFGKSKRVRYSSLMKVIEENETKILEY